MYPFSKIERVWSKRWLSDRTYEPDLARAKKPFFNLMMFPYPSAEGLHVGNMYAFTGSDIFGRSMRMQGYDVFQPIGLDGFGIHSENYAMQKGVHPAKQAKVSEKNFYRQLQSIGNGFSWEERLETYDPAYYRWTQWLAIQFFKRGLMYRAKASVNWCPSCKTVLADEQVVGGVCERCDSVVLKRELEQWFLRITKYADRLLANIEKIDWPEQIKAAQRNWIGRSEGVVIHFPFSGNERGGVEVFTTRPDTIWGVTCLVLAPEHPLVATLLSRVENRVEVEAYREAAARAAESERLRDDRRMTGVRLAGVSAVNPVNDQEIPVWISDYVLARYGTGAIMSVPAHDERDLRFSETFGLPVVNAPLVPGEKVIAQVGGKKRVTHRLRDWLISRQRYWGPPIPLIRCARCEEEVRRRGKKIRGITKGELENPGWIPVPEKDLPVKLPLIKDFRPTGSGVSPLAASRSFISVDCPRCGGKARRETDVSDTFLDSAWYFLRYPSVRYEKGPFDPRLTKKWLPVGRYIGGAEHAVLHLLYARFVTMALKDMKHLSFDEPAPVFRVNGLIIRDGRKMSKSKGNVVNPDEYIRSIGADALRLHLMFIGPFEQGGDFRDAAVAGITRFLNRVWIFGTGFSERLHERRSSVPRGKVPSPWMHRSIKRITEGLSALKYNTCIAELMVILNRLTERGDEVTRRDAEAFLLLLAPFAPFITEELWSRFGHTSSIHRARLPVYEERWLKEETYDVVVQVNSRVRDTVSVGRDASEDELREAALASERVQNFLAGRTVARVIVVPGRLVNIVTGE